MTTAFYHDERCLWHSWGEAVLTLPVGGYVQPPAGTSHLENPETKRRFKNLLEVSGLWDHLDVRKAEPVTLDDILRVHTKVYVDLFRDTSSKGTAAPGKTSLMVRDSFEAASLSAGLVKQACCDVLAGNVRNAYALARPPGHHAEPTRSMGFCVFDNVAVAARYAQEAYGIKRVAIIDFDVHHGNGTEAAFFNDPSVMMCSFFQHPFYPYSGLDPSDNMVNVPLPASTRGDVVRSIVEERWLPALRNFEPELIIISAGFDAHREDDLGQMGLVEDDYVWITKRLKEIAKDYAQGRIVSCLEGGYNLSALGRSVVAHVKALADI